MQSDNLPTGKSVQRMTIWRALQGLVMGSGAPLGWIIIQYLRGVDILADIEGDPVLYIYLLVATMVVFAAFGVYVGRQEGAMRQWALRDMLTGLYNLRHFRDRLDSELAEAERRDTPLSLLFLDLDHFKKVNDTHGHAAGDVVLKEMAHEVGRSLRRNELFARTGGEEFALLLPQTDSETAQALANRVLDVIRTMEISVNNGTKLKITASVGVAEWRAGEPARAFIERADAAMYGAKQAGRDRVEAAT